MQDPSLSLKIAPIHQPNESIVQLLEEALKAAKRGDVQAIAAVTLIVTDLGLKPTKD